MWLPYSGVNELVSDIFARATPCGRRALDDKVVSVHDDAFKFSFLVFLLVTLADARDAPTEGLNQF